MDINSYLILGLAVLVILLRVIPRATGAADVRISRLERQVDHLTKTLGVVEKDETTDVDPEVRSLARSGNKIAAIKKYREISGANLRDAKDYVDRLA